MKLTVNLPKNPYDIIIQKDSLAQVGDWVKDLWKPQKIAIITDDHVSSLYLETVKTSLEKAGFESIAFVFPEGESSKNLETVNQAYEFLVKEDMTRSDGISALGGGVVGDLAGFVAATYMRGIHFLQVPTSLTAQVDSSIGGKTGVNTPFAKNMVGSFYQPDGVLIDPQTLKTLGKRELIEGMGEVVKYGLIDDVQLWKDLEQMDGSIDSILEHAENIIYRSCEVKRKIVVEDEASDPTSELIAFDAAVVNANQALQNNYQEVKNRLGSKQAAIFLAHAEFLQDDELLNSTKVLIEQKHSAAWAWQHVIDSRIAQITKLDDAVLAARAVDLSDVAQRVLRQLLHMDNEPVMTAQEPSVLVADDLTPSDTANLDPDMILGFITAKGGPTSHTAIIARAMGIPAIVAAGDAILDIDPRTPCILDGFNGALYLKPTQAEITSAQALF